MDPSQGVVGSPVEAANFDLLFDLDLPVDVQEHSVEAAEIEMEIDEIEENDRSETEMEIEEQASSQPNSQDLDNMIVEATSENTRKATQWGITKFQEWIQKRNRNIDLKTITTDNLNDELRRFYGEVKSKQGKALTPSAYNDIW